MIIFLHGADRYRLERRLGALRQAFTQKYGDLNTVLLDGATIGSVDELVSQVTTNSLFGDRRLVVVKNLLSENKDKDLLAGLADEITAGRFVADEGNILIFVETVPKVDNSKLAQLLKKQKMEEFIPLSGSQLNRFIRQLAEQLGLKMEPAAVNLLAANASYPLEDKDASEAADLFYVENELKQLVAYKPGGTVTVSDVQEVCAQVVIVGHIFAFTDYLGQRNSKDALRELTKLRASGKEEAFIFAMVAKHVRNLLLTSDLHKQGMTPAMITQATKLHPFVVKKALAQSKHFSVDEMAGILRRLLEIDRQQKTGELVDEAIALDQLVLESAG